MAEEVDYDTQKSHNEEVFKQGVQIMRPDIYVLMATLDATGVDFMILVQVLYALERIATGTKYGHVQIFIENGIATFVKGEESKKINLPVIKPSLDNENKGLL